MYKLQHQAKYFKEKRSHLLHNITKFILDFGPSKNISNKSYTSIYKQLE